MQLKKIISTMLFMLMVATVVPTKAAVVISAKLKNEMNQTLTSDLKIYEVDAAKSKEQLDRIDQLFESRMDIKKAVHRTSKKGTRQSFRKTVKKNRALTVEKNGNVKKSLTPEKAFDLFYIKKPMQRSFRKTIAKPVQAGLEEAEVITLGKTFIQTHELCPMEKEDGLGKRVVVDRKKRSFGEKTHQEFVVSQKVRFTRKFQGLDVVNARQSVDIHPQTKEVLGYKTKDWRVIKTDSGKMMAPRQNRSVIKELENQFKQRTGNINARKTKTAYYQTENKLIPVMMVYFGVEEAKEGEAIAEEEVVIVSLDKTITSPTKEKTGRAPTEK